MATKSAKSKTARTSVGGKRSRAAAKKSAAAASSTKKAKTKTKKAVSRAKKAKAPSPRKAPSKAAPGRKRAAARPKRPARRKSKPSRRARLRRKEWERFREVLLQKQRELTQAYNISKGDSRSKLDDGTEDYIDYAVSSYAREFLLSLTELDRTQLLLVEEALKRIDRGDFGSCLQCGEPIPMKRLEVQPWARYCLRCQELEERGLLQDLPLPDEDEDLDEVDLDDEEGAYDADEEEGEVDEDTDEDDEGPEDNELTITDGEN